MSAQRYSSKWSGGSTKRHVQQQAADNGGHEMQMTTTSLQQQPQPQQHSNSKDCKQMQYQINDNNDHNKVIDRLLTKTAATVAEQPQQQQHNSSSNENAATTTSTSKTVLKIKVLSRGGDSGPLTSNNWENGKWKQNLKWKRNVAQQRRCESSIVLMNDLIAVTTTRTTDGTIRQTAWFNYNKLIFDRSRRLTNDEDKSRWKYRRRVFVHSADQ